MIRATQLRLQQEIAEKFGYETIVSHEGANTYRDVLWTPPEIALRVRSEQSASLGLQPESIFPFLSFWRTGYRANMGRFSTAQAWRGVSTDDTLTKKYKMRPVDLAFQVEFWTNDVEEYEAAIENWYKWKMPDPELELTDSGGVTFQLPMSLGDAQDNSRLPELFDIGEIQRGTFPLAIGSYVITDGGTFVLVTEVQWAVWDYSATGDPADAVLIKNGVIT